MITIGTTFSGIGAPEQALKNLGIEHQVKWACDIDADAKKTYLNNHGSEKWYDDILDINPAELEPVDIYVFGFPCTDISTEGEMDLSKGRSSLAHTSLDIIEAILPKVIIFENVAALLFSKFKEFYENIVERIKENYDFCAYKVNSKDFGVPQSRPRVYGVGIRKDLGFSASGFRFNTSKSHISDILEEKVDEKYFISQERVAKILETCRTKQKDFVYLPNKLGEVKHVRSNGFQPDKKIRYSGNSFCLTCSVHHGIMEGGRIRKFTPRECARLQGFPDSFKIPSADSTAFAQFGNSMTVPVIQQILDKIICQL